MMNLYPLKKISIISKFSAEEILERLSNKIDYSQGILNISNPSKPFKGEIFEDSFEIYHVSNSKNSFVPIVKGKISKIENHSKIDVIIKLPPLSLFLLLIFSAYLLFLIFQNLGISPAKSNDLSGMIMIVLGAIAYSLMLNAFNKECRFAENFLSELFESLN